MRCSADAFTRRAAPQIPQGIGHAVNPLLQCVEGLTARIREMDEQIECIVGEHYPEAVHLQQVKGVGALTALAFVLWVEDPKRFTRSRDAGAYFGLVPRLDELATIMIVHDRPDIVGSC